MTLIHVLLDQGLFSAVCPVGQIIGYQSAGKNVFTDATRFSFSVASEYRRLISPTHAPLAAGTRNRKPLLPPPQNRLYLPGSVHVLPPTIRWFKRDWPNKRLPPMRGMLDRGLMEIRTDPPFPKAYFIAAGLAALRILAQDRRSMDPKKFAHVRVELGIETPDPTEQPGSAG